MGGIYAYHTEDGRLYYYPPKKEGQFLPPPLTEYPIRLDEANVKIVPRKMLLNGVAETRQVCLIAPLVDQDFRGVNREQMPFFHLSSDKVKDAQISGLEATIRKLHDSIASLEDQIEDTQLKREKSVVKSVGGIPCPTCTIVNTPEEIVRNNGMCKSGCRQYLRGG